MKHSQYQDIVRNKESSDTFDLPTRISPLARHVRGGESIQTFRVQGEDGKKLTCARIEVGCIVVWWDNLRFEALEVTDVRTKDHVAQFGLDRDVVIFQGKPFQGRGPRKLFSPPAWNFMKTNVYGDQRFTIYPSGSDPTVVGGSQGGLSGVTVTWDRVLLVPSNDDTNQLVKDVNRSWSESKEIISQGLKAFSNRQKVHAIEGLNLLANTAPYKK
jgi:hypothetical protein